jgi:cytosine permease
MAQRESKAVSSSQLEDYAISPVPIDQRRSTWNVAVTSCAWVISLSTIFTGGALVSGLSFANAIIASFFGMLILGVYGYFQGWMGARYGVATTVLARHAFGRYGSSLLGSLLALTLGVGWFAYQISFFGLTLSQMFPGYWFAEPKVAMVWGGILMMLTAFVGYRGLSALSMIAVPLVAILSVWGIIKAVQHSGSWGALFHTQPTGDPITVFAGITLVVGNAAAGAVIFPDITRFGKSAGRGALGASLGYFFGGLFCTIAGAAMAVAAQVPDVGSTPNIPAAMSKIGLGFFAFLILVFAQWTTNDNNLYSGALGLRNVVRLPKPFIVVILGVLSLIIALIGLQNLFVPFLNFLGSYVPPFAGVMIADHWVVSRIQKRAYRFGADTVYAKWNVLSIVMIVVGGWVGSHLGFGISSINSTVIAFVGYIVLASLFQWLNWPFEIGKKTEEASGF